MLQSVLLVPQVMYKFYIYIGFFFNLKSYFFSCIKQIVMPHNLYLHGFIIQSRCREWRTKRPRAESVDDDNKQWILSSVTRKFTLLNDELEKSEPMEADVPMETTLNNIEKKRFDSDGLRKYLKSSLKDNLLYNFIDLVVALLFAFYVNSAILIVAASNFYYAPASQQHAVTDLFDAHDLLSRYLSPAAGVIFALALLCAGQSSTITATLAGQVVMSGFLGMSTRPWVRRVVTRLVAIIPALVAACIAGRSGLSQLLVGSQVALSVQLPFAVVPLVIFTSWKKVMKVDLVINESNTTLERTQATVSWIDKLFPRIPSWRPSWWHPTKQKFFPHLFLDGKSNENTPAMIKPDTSSIATTSPIILDELPQPLLYNNGWITMFIAVLISLLLIGLNGYLVVAAALGI